MKADSKYVAIVALAVLAVAFGLAGTVAPPLAEEMAPSEDAASSSSDSGSITHFMYPPSFDSGWVNIVAKNGQFFALKHGLNTTEVFVDIAGKQSLDPMGGALAWSKSYGGAGHEEALSLVQTFDGGYALTGVNDTAGNADFCLVKVDSAGVLEWSKSYGGADHEGAFSLVQTFDGGYALAGYNATAGNVDFCLVKVDSSGVMEWSKSYGGAGFEDARSIVQTSDGGYALAGSTYSPGPFSDFWLVKTDSAGSMQWSKDYGIAEGFEEASSIVQTSDGGYALAGYTESLGVGGDFWLVKTDIEMGLALTDVAEHAVTMYRGKTDLYWNYVRVRIWTIQEPTWQYGDINQDGIVDAKDLYILSRNYGKTFSLLSLSGIAAIAGISTYKKRKHEKN